MADQTRKEKPKYEAPVLVPLGELARGTGACKAGSAVVGGCVVGVRAGLSPCTVGALANGCGNGGNPY